MFGPIAHSKTVKPFFITSLYLCSINRLDIFSFKQKRRTTDGVHTFKGTASKGQSNSKRKIRDTAKGANRENRAALTTVDKTE